MPKALYAPTKKAFLPFNGVYIDETQLQETLFSVYHETSTYTFSSSSDRMGQQYMQQIFCLINKFVQIVINNNSKNLALELQTLQILRRNLSETNYVDGNAVVQAAYFLTYKKNMELIYYLIKDWNPEDQYKFIIKLGAKIAVCSAGAHTQLGEAVFELTQKPSVVSWLAELRKQIVDLFSEEWIQRLNIVEGSSIHTHYFCRTHAQNSGWNIPGYSLIQDYVDTAGGFCVHDDGTMTAQLNNHFEASYTLSSMRDNLVTNYNRFLSDYDKKALSYDERQSIENFFSVFLEEHKIFGLDSLYIFDEYTNEWRISPEFHTCFPEFVTRFLIKEGLVGSPLLELINGRMIPKIKAEILRLVRKYGEEETRIGVLTETLDFLKMVTSDLGKLETDAANEIYTYLARLPYQESLIQHKSYWEEITLQLLNILMIVPFGLPGLIKYAATGHFFFSYKGSSMDTIDELASEVVSASYAA